MFIKLKAAPTGSIRLLNVSLVRMFQPLTKTTRAFFNEELGESADFIESLDEIHEKIKAAQANQNTGSLGIIETDWDSNAWGGK